MGYTQQIFANELDRVCRRGSIPKEQVHRVSLFCQRDSKHEFDTSDFWGEALYVLEDIEYRDMLHRVAAG